MLWRCIRGAAVVAASSCMGEVTAAISADLLDDLCARFSANCSACTSATATPYGGELVTLQCQWVHGYPAECIGIPPEDEADALTRWIARHEDIIWTSSGVKRYYDVRPVCRSLARTPSACLGAADEPSAVTPQSRCDRVTPNCGACIVNGCAFCAEQTGSLSSAGGSVGVRCVSPVPTTHATGATQPCAVKCTGREGSYDYQYDHQDVAVGFIEYPPWQAYGLGYARGQRCDWYVGGVGTGGTVSVEVEHGLARHDALHIWAGGRTSGGLPDEVLGMQSPSPFPISALASPMMVQFFSDGDEESVGFFLFWQYSQPSTTTVAGGVHSGSDPGGGGRWEDAAVVVPIVVGTVFLFLLCLFCDCIRKCRRAASPPPHGAELSKVLGRARQRESVARVHGVASHKLEGSGDPPRRPSAAAHDIPNPPPAKAAHGVKGPPVSRWRLSHAKAAAMAASGSDGRASQPQDSSESESDGASGQHVRNPPSAKPDSGAAGPRVPNAPRGKTPSANRGRPVGAQVPRTSTPPQPPHGASASGAASPSPKRRNSTSPTAKPGGAERSQHSGTNVHAAARPPNQSHREISPPASFAMTDAQSCMAAVRQELLEAADASDADRKAVLRQLQRRWHPDKNSGTDQAVCTIVFQYISSNSDWFLSGRPPRCGDV